jgi:hypothetical protein
MSLITDALVFVLSSYLIAVNALAGIVLTWLPDTVHDTEPPAVATSLPEPRTGNGLFELPSVFSPDRLSRILLESAEYQRAAALEGVTPPPRPLADPRHAVVNIVCTFTTRDTIKSTTGTGFIIDPAGVIMTNAHVAQYLLLSETDVMGEGRCDVRTGEEDSPRYRAELLYLPPTWIEKNAALITEAVPLGTGERDYALLHITATLDRSPLPASFPALPFSIDFLPQGTQGLPVTAIGFPAPDGVTSGETLAVVVATTTISELYTFGSNRADVFSIRGSVVGAGGSSGGPILNSDGEVIGMIATRGDDSVDGPGSLRAITVSHIHQTISEETGFPLSQNVSGEVDLRADVFKDTVAPFLLSLLTRELE